MELHQLEAFEAVLLHHSFTRAAEVLFLTQPAVTRQIAALETELKTPLFERLGRTVVPTAAGEVLHRYAEEILRLRREAREAVGEISVGAAGRLTVGASSTLATYVLPPLLRRFRAEYPKVEIAVTTGLSARILERVREGRADLGLVTTERDAARPDPALTLTPLADFDTVVVLPRDHPLTGRECVRTGDLAGVPLTLMEPGTNLRTYADHLFASAGVTPNVALELDNAEAIKRMVEAGLGVSLLPEVSVRSEVALGNLVVRPLADEPREHRRVVLARRRDKFLSASLNAFVGLLGRELPNL
jgi:DNA-binding transcriptional LysR family regulator